MLTLQSTFSYDDVEPAPFDQANVTVGFPQYEGVDDTETGTVTLTATGAGKVSFQQKLYNNEYHLSIPASGIFGPKYGQLLVKYMAALTKDGPKIRLGDVTIPFKVRYGASEEAMPQELDVLYFLGGARLPPAATDPAAAPSTMATFAFRAPETPETAPHAISGPTRRANPLFGVPPSVMDKIRADDSAGASAADNLVNYRLFAVNKAVYVKYLDDNFSTFPAVDECVLLYMIGPLLDLSGPAPKLGTVPESTQREVCYTVLEYFGVPEPGWPSITDEFIKRFLDFFDFPLKMPKIHLLSLAGSLTLKKPTEPGAERRAEAQAGAVEMKDFSWYHLNAVFYVADTIASADPTRHVSRYDWPETSKVDGNKMTFAFTERYSTANILGPVTVTVTSYDELEQYHEEFSPSDPALERLNIVLDLRQPLEVPGAASGRPSNKKLRGKIVSLVKNCTLKCSVVVQAKATEDDPWATVATGESDKAGDFAMAYPFGNYAAAQALTSLDPDRATPLKIKDSKSPSKESISPDFIFILLQTSSGDPEKKEDCGCTGTVAAGRLPSQADVIQSDQYTQDVGGTCTSLTVPNRTLREYRYTAIVRNSDPDVANYTLSSQESVDPDTNVSTVMYQLTTGGKINRRRIDLDNPVQWEDVSGEGKDQVLYEAVTISTGHILHYRSEFRADGYSLGDLVYSLPLAPGQKKEIAIMDSSHAFRGGEEQSLSQSERLAADLSSERDIMDQLGGSVSELMAGSSEASTQGVSAAAGGSVDYQGWAKANVGVAGGFAKAASSAQQNSGRNLGGFFGEVLRQRIHQNAQGYRQRNSTIVTTAKEAQLLQAETTVVANHNHCHSLTLMHYEVLRHFAVYQELVGVEECVFIPFPMTKFSPENISRWADVLCTGLLPLHGNTYRDPARFALRGVKHPLAGAFDAVERVRTSWRDVDWPEGRYCDEAIIWAQGEFTASVYIPRPNTRYDMILSLPIITQQTSHSHRKSFLLGVITGGLSWLLPGTTSKTATQVEADISDKFMRLDANYQTRRPADCMRIYNLDPVAVEGSIPFDPLEFFHNSAKDESAWQAYATVLGYEGGTRDGVRAMLKDYFLNATISDWNEIWRTKIAPEVYLRITNSLSFDGISAGDFSVLAPYRGGLQQTRVSFSGQAQKVRKDIQFLTLRCAILNVSLLLNAGVQYIIQNLRISYSTQHYNGVLFSGTINNDLLDGVTVYCPLSEAEMRFPRAEDRWLAQRLITHLNQNLEHYNRVLLYSLDAQRRFMVLDGFHIEVFLDDGASAGYHSLSSVLKNSPVAMAGNAMVFPVSPGYKVDRSMIIKTHSDPDVDPETALLDFYQPETPPPPYRLSVPSKGVYSEALIGQCDSCEKTKPDSSQDWTRFTTDEPAQIQELKLPEPQLTKYEPTAKDFTSPLVQIQTAPTNPEPGRGLDSAMELLGKANLFKDITGLEGNQQNAMKTYLSNQESARAIAGVAGGAATQAHNTTNSAQIMGTIQQAQDSKLLSKEEAAQLAKQHIQNQIDGGQAQKAALNEKKAAAKPSLPDAAVSAAHGNKRVEATTTDGEGNESTILISPGSTRTSTLARVRPAVPAMQQKGDTCWAVAATMLASWRAGKVLTPEEVLATAGDVYLALWNIGGPLPADKKDVFLVAMGLIGERPASYSPSKFVRWMKAYGPLWVTTDANTDPDPKRFSPHAKILVQIDGDGNDNGDNTTFTWLNPASGRRVVQSFKDFLIGYEQMETDNAGVLFTQIVHYGDKMKMVTDSNDLESSSVAVGDDFGVDFPSSSSAT